MGVIFPKFNFFKVEDVKKIYEFKNQSNSVLLNLLIALQF
jgi:hypothetical protein